MDIDTAANPAGAEGTPAQEPVNAAPEAQTQAEGTTTATIDTTTEQPDDFDGLLATPVEEAEIEYEGAKFKVPAPLKDAFLRQQDYTQKTMSLAEERRLVEAQKSQIQEARNLNAAEITAFTEINSLNAQLAEFNPVDWTQLDYSDPEVQRAKGVYDALKSQLQTKQAQLNEHFAIKSQRAQQEAAKEREETDKAMAQIVKDWGPEKRSQFEAFAVAQGIPAEYAGQAGPAEMKIIRLAMIGAQAEQQRIAALRAATNANTKPANEVGAGAGSGPSDPNGMTPEQYRAWRAKQGD